MCNENSVLLIQNLFATNLKLIKKTVKSYVFCYGTIILSFKEYSIYVSSFMKSNESILTMAEY